MVFTRRLRDGVARITNDLACESGFNSRKDLPLTARHRKGDNVYLIRFHYIVPGGWDVPRENP